MGRAVNTAEWWALADTPISAYAHGPYVTLKKGSPAA